MSDSAKTTNRVISSGPIRMSWRAQAAPASAAVAGSVSELLRSAHALWRQGDRNAALAEAQKAVSLAPEDVEALGTAGAIAFDQGSHDLAERLFGRAAALLPQDAPERIHVKSLRALALAHARRWAEASAEAAEATSGDGELPAQIHWRVGRVLSMTNRGVEAVGHLRRAVALEPARPDYRADFADSLRDMGDFDGAEREYEAAVAANPGAGRAHSSLAHLRKWTPATAHVARLREALEAPQLSDLDRSYICYGLFKEYDDLGDTDTAWSWLTRANDLAFRSAGAWRAGVEFTEFVQLKEGFPTPASVRGPSPAARGGRRPIFVMGLPRSGTTLVERILGAHSQVAPIGETPMMSRLFRPEWDRACMQAGPEHAAERIDWARLAQGYLDETALLAGAASYSVDKMPDNALLAGPIRRAFPDAVLVLVTRAPMDVLFGCYKAPMAFPWSRRFEDLCSHYVNFSGLMAHWFAVMGDSLIVVDYQRLVSDPAAQIPLLLRRCGLPFEEACLRPHETEGVVGSSSSTQVRSPITRERIGGWRRYERELAPLAGRLAAAGFPLD